MSPAPFFSSNKKEERWVSHITRTYTIDLGFRPVVFEVPQSLRDTKPQAYTPQAVGLGPYHHFRPEIQQMESQKRTAVKAYLRVTEFQKFIQFVKEIIPLKLGSGNKEKFPSTILSFYDRYLDFDSNTLVWIVAIDGIFLLHFLNQELNWKDQRLAADIIMLENQIPLTLVKEIKNALRHSFPDAVDIKLLDEFYRFCCQQSPLKLSDRPQRKKAAFKKHMLHFLYDLTVNNYEDEGVQTDADKDEGEQTDADKQPSASCLPSVGNLYLAISKVKEFSIKMMRSVISGIEQAKAQGLQIPENIEKVFKLLQKLKETSDLNDNRDKHDQLRLADKIDVPSVSQLYQIAKIEFARTDGGIRNIWFDESKNKLHLPEITLCEISEVVLRNLVAYEAAKEAEEGAAEEAAKGDAEETAKAKPGSTVKLAEYVDLMCGLIDAEIDVNLLKEFEIIKGNLPDEEIVHIFNGINKSTQRPDEESEVQKTVQKLKNKFNNLRIVKAYKFIDKSCAALESWIKRLFPIFVLMLLALQSFCEVYGCSSRRLGYAAAPTASSFSPESEVKLSMPRKVLGYDHTLP